MAFRLDDEAKELFDKASKVWGEDPQCLVAVEECSELAAAVCQYLNGKGDSNAVMGELADVIIMTEQLRLIFEKKHGEGSVDEAIKTKLAKLKGKLDKF